MNRANHSNFKKRATVTTAIILAIALLIGGTLAWNDFSQHATNPFRGGQGSGNYSVTLNDRFDPVHNWTKGQTESKTVSVINLGESSHEVFVRLSLKEFMQTRLQSTEFITDEDGKQILFATFAEEPRIGEYLTMEDARIVMGDGHYYTPYPVQTAVDQQGNPIYTEYATTNDTEIRNGIYGKPMLIPGEIDRMWGTALSGDVAHTVQSNAECDYEPFLWGTMGAQSNEADEADRTGIRDYITFEGAPIIKLADWAADLDPETGKPKWGEFWIVDPDDGWAYWGEPLQPGIKTGDFISSVTLNHSPLDDGEEPLAGRFDYFMHIDMQAIAGETAEVFETEIVKFYNDPEDPDPEENSDEKNALLNLMRAVVEERAGATTED